MVNDKAKTLERVKKILKTIERAHSKNKENDKEPTQPNPKPSVDTTFTQHTNKCQLKGHNHPWDNCPNNLTSKNYTGIHYSKIREKERASTLANSRDDASKSEEETISKKTEARQMPQLRLRNTQRDSQY